MHILVKGNITVNNTGTAAASTNRNINIIFKNCAPFANCISKINNTQIDNAEYIDTVMSLYNLIEYSDNYLKTSGSILQYCKEILLQIMLVILLIQLLLKQKKPVQTNNNGRIDNVEIMVPLKYLSNFWRTLKIPLINCEV